MRQTGIRTIFVGAAGAAALALSACGTASENNLAQIDNEIAAADIDPAVTGAIEDEILVDPALVQQSNANGVRPPERPLQAPYPVDNAVRAAGDTAGAAAGAGAGAGSEAPVMSSCGVPFQHGAQWAERLPAEFPGYPGARVSEAAGADRGSCRVRVVSFATDHGSNQVLDWYRGIGSRAGFSVEHEQRGADHIVGGINEGNDGAFLAIVTPEGSGSKVSLIVNNGR